MNPLPDSLKCVIKAAILVVAGLVLRCWIHHSMVELYGNDFCGKLSTRLNFRYKNQLRTTLRRYCWVEDVHWKPQPRLKSVLKNSFYTLTAVICSYSAVNQLCAYYLRTELSYIYSITCRNCNPYHTGIQTRLGYSNW